MDFPFLVIQFLNGLANASFLFITASGLTIVFGVTRILNFAHGSFYMLGAYIAAALVPAMLDWWYGPATFWAAIFLSAGAVSAVGVVVEVVVLRRIYHVPELFQLLATFGVVLVVQDVVIKTFGAADILGPRAPGLQHAVSILGQRFSAYELVAIAAGPTVLALLWLVLKHTRFGILVRAATQDRQMVEALGVNQALLFTATLALGSFLAGFAGALQIAKAPANLGMDMAMIAEAFVVTVIGGMGSVPGAFIAAVLIGELQAFGILVFPKLTLVLVFLAMGVVLIVRPWGLLGRPEPAAGRAAEERQIVPWSRASWTAAGIMVALLAALPLVAEPYVLKLVDEIMIFGLFALSLNLLTGTGGVLSFSHAAYFGLGAYGAALLVAKLGSGMELALAMAPVIAAVAAALFGFFIARLSGIYLAMLTLAAAQIVFAVAFQWVWLTGGENGMVGVWPSRWATGPVAYYYLVLVLTAAATLALVRLTEAPFGYTLRAARDSAVRAEAIGVSVYAHRWLAFVVAGAAAGLAGGLYVFSKGSIDPAVLSIETSVDGLLMVLIGGLQSVAGPLIGAAALHLVKDELMRLIDVWRLVLGVVIIALVLVSPTGLVGLSARALARLRPRRAGAP